MEGGDVPSLFSWADGDLSAVLTAEADGLLD